mgnify:CR=1 FL=1
MNTELKYRTFTQLLSEVASDFTMYNVESMIDPSQLIKVAQRVNYDLGLRIHGTKEKIIEIENCKAKLPDDFYILNYAMLCGEEEVTKPTITGRQTENVILGHCGDCDMPISQCKCKVSYSVECKTGEKVFVQIVETRKHEVKTYNRLERIHVSDSSGRSDALDNSFMSAYIKNGFMYINFGDEYRRESYYSDFPNYGVVDIKFDHRLFISYEGTLEDEEGNLLVLDHPMINEYYEYAIKQRLLENLYMNGEDVVQRIQLIEQRLKAARNNALSIVNTPDFAEMYTLWQTNRRAQYAKYYDMFKSYDYIRWVRPLR